MIIIDIETTGVDPTRHQMVSLGAVDYKTGETFYGECRIGKYDEWTSEALQINGFSRDDIYDPDKQTAPELYDKFIKWANGRSTTLAGHNVAGFDLQFLLKNHKKLKKIGNFPFSYRTIDLHSVAYAKLGKKYQLPHICNALGVAVEPNPHNALEGALAEYKCFKKLEEFVCTLNNN